MGLAIVEAAGGDDVKTTSGNVSRLVFHPRHTFFTLSAVFGRITKWPLPLIILLLPFLKSFFKPTLAAPQTDGAPPQTDETLNRGESACPNDTRQKAGG